MKIWAIEVSDFARGGHLGKKYFSEVGFWRTFFCYMGPLRYSYPLSNCLLQLFFMLGLFLP